MRERLQKLALLSTRNIANCLIPRKTQGAKLSPRCLFVYWVKQILVNKGNEKNYRKKKITLQMNFTSVTFHFMHF